MTLNHNFPSNRQVETEDDQKIDSLGDAMSRHRKVAGWYKDMMEDDQYRSNAVYLEVKMSELLGDAWHARSSEPDMVRACVCSDMLGSDIYDAVQFVSMRACVRILLVNGCKIVNRLCKMSELSRVCLLRSHYSAGG
jgi:hypothetical protein